MDDAVARASELLTRWEEQAVQEAAGHPPLFDAHTHLGTDVGGMLGNPDQLLAYMDRYGVAMANVFCLDEPDRHPAFRAGNDRTLQFADGAPGRLVPYVRLDLDEDPVAEAQRCLDRGARGIKLHPRAQKFTFGDSRLESVFALAAEREAPILIHAGLGLPPIAADLEHLCDRHPETKLIVAHAGIADLTALGDRLAGRPGIFFDTSTWSAVDLLDLFARVPAEQILYASDFPYGQQPGSLLVLLRSAAAAGVPESKLGEILGGSADRLVRGEQPLRPTVTYGATTTTMRSSLARIHEYLVMAMPLLWTAQTDIVGFVQLGLNICEGPDERDDDALVEIRELLAAVQVLWRHADDLSAGERARTARMVFRMVHIADLLAVTAPTTDRQAQAIP